MLASSKSQCDAHPRLFPNREGSTGIRRAHRSLALAAAAINRPNPSAEALRLTSVVVDAMRANMLADAATALLRKNGFTVDGQARRKGR